MTGLSRWQQEDGFPSDAYFAAVAAALDAADATVFDWHREEAWETDYRIDRDVVAGSRLATQAEHGLFISWRCDELDEPQSPDGFSGPGWYWVPYSKSQVALGDFAEEFDLAYMAEPANVAAAVGALLGEDGTGDT